MKLNKKWLLIILSIVILISSGAVTAFLVFKARKVTAQDLYDRAKLLMAEKKFDQARVYFHEALKKSTENDQLYWELASFEAQMGNSSEAQSFAQKAWNAGKQDKECFMVLLNHSGLPTVDLQVDYGRRLLQKMTDLELKQELEADLYFAVKDYISSLELYQMIYELRPSADLAVKIAIVLVSSNKTDDAISVLEKAVGQSIFDDRSYTMLINLKFLKNRQLDLDQEYQKAAKLGLASFAFQYQQAFLYTLSHQSSKALAVLDGLLAGKVSFNPDSSKARILMAYNAFTLNKPAKIDFLLNLLKDVDSPEAEGERKLYRLLQGLAKIDQNELKVAASQERSMQAIYKLLPDNFIVGLLNARFKALSGDVEGALAFYNKEEDPLHKLWSRFSLDHVYALKQAGRIDEALGLLSAFHQFTKQGSLESLSLQRNLFLANAHYKRALEVQELLEKLFPNNEKLQLQRASILLESGRVPEAKEFLADFKKSVSKSLRSALEQLEILVYLRLRDYPRVLKIAADQKDFQLYKAQAMNSLNRFGEAEKLYADLYEANPTSTNARAYLLFIISRQKVDYANELINEFNSGPFQSKGWLALASALLKANDGKFKTALDYLQKAKDFPEEYNAALYLEADIFYRQGRYLNAVSHLNLLTVYTPNDYRVFHLKALCYLQTGEIKSARQSLDKALVLYPQSSLLKMTMSKVLFREGRLREAFSEAEILLRHYGLSQAAFELCLNVLVKEQKISEALAFLGKYKQGKTEADQAQLEADIYFKGGDPEKAFMVLAPYKNLMPVKVRLAFMKANLPGQTDMALKDLQMPIALWHELAIVLLTKKDYSQASFCYLKVANSQSSDAVTRNNLAWCYLNLSQLSEAEKWAREAYAIEPRNNEIIHTFSQVLLENKKYRQCQDLLEPIVAKSIVDPRHNYTLAKVYETLGEPEEALFQYKKSLEGSRLQNWTLPIPQSELEKKVRGLVK